MARKRYTTEQIIGLLREAEVGDAGSACSRYWPYTEVVAEMNHRIAAAPLAPKLPMRGWSMAIVGTHSCP